MNPFTTKLVSYTKSRAKNKIPLVEELVVLLDELEEQFQQLPKHTLRAKLLKRRITVYTTDVICTLVEAEDWSGIAHFEARDCCEWFEIITVVAMYKPNKLDKLFEGCKQAIAHVKEHTEEWTKAAQVEQLPELEEIVNKYANDANIHQELQMLSTKLNVDKKKLRQMLLELEL